MAFHLEWFPFYPRDFFNSGHVKVMTAEQKFFYLELLTLQWEEGSIPSDRRHLARALRIDDERFREVWPEISACFVKMETGEFKGRLVNLRMNEEREKAIELSKTNRLKAVQAANKRWGNNGR